MKKKRFRCTMLFILIFGIFLIQNQAISAAEVVTPQPYAVPLPSINVDIGQAETPEEISTSIQLLLLVTLIALVPSFLLMLTCLPRIIIVLHFLRSAMGTQQMPPNQVLMGIALIMTMFLMGPTFSEINDNALQPFSQGQIGQEEAIVRGMAPIRDFMFRQVYDKDLSLFAQLANETYTTVDEIPNRVLIPAFIITEMKKGFMIGFILYIPFIVLDMVVASTLMAMGMMMLPPSMISLPFKVLLFILVDGWNLVIGQLIQTFR